MRRFFNYNEIFHRLFSAIIIIAKSENSDGFSERLICTHDIYKAGGNMNFVKKKYILIGVLVTCALMAFYLLNDTYIEPIDVDNYAFESLLGKS